jgi:hypothetical protein
VQLGHLTPGHEAGLAAGSKGEGCERPRAARADPSSYLERLGLETGKLLDFARRPEAAPLALRCSNSELEHGGHRL